MSEPFDIKKLLDFSPTALLKSVSLGLKVLAVVGLVFCVYTTVQTIRKPKPTQNITVGSGGQVTIRNEAPKKKLIPFIETFLSTETHGTYDAGIRAGCRIEF